MQATGRSRQRRIYQEADAAKDSRPCRNWRPSSNGATPKQRLACTKGWRGDVDGASIGPMWHITSGLGHHQSYAGSRLRASSWRTLSDGFPATGPSPRYRPCYGYRPGTNPPVNGPSTQTESSKTILEGVEGGETFSQCRDTQGDGRA